MAIARVMQLPSVAALLGRCEVSATQSISSARLPFCVFGCSGQSWRLDLSLLQIVVHALKAGVVAHPPASKINLHFIADGSMSVFRIMSTHRPATGPSQSIIISGQGLRLAGASLEGAGRSGQRKATRCRGASCPTSLSEYDSCNCRRERLGLCRQN